ncbi:hypothetical protein GCM10009725_10360 [Aeromicrobium tamlense]
MTSSRMMPETVAGANCVRRAICAWLSPPASRTTRTTRLWLETRRAAVEPGLEDMASTVTHVAVVVKC